MRRILDRLAKIGLADAPERGWNPSVRIRDRHSLAAAVRALFHKERRARERFSGAVRRVCDREDFQTGGIWIESPAVRGPGSVQIGGLGSADTIEQAVAIAEDLMLPRVEVGWSSLQTKRDRTQALLTQEPISIASDVASTESASNSSVVHRSSISTSRSWTKGALNVWSASP